MWIETLLETDNSLPKRVTFLRRCGLKHSKVLKINQDWICHLLTKVWIETLSSSHESNVSSICHLLTKVWIETTRLWSMCPGDLSHLLTKVWIETIWRLMVLSKYLPCHLLTKVWIETSRPINMPSSDQLSPSYEGVDWNSVRQMWTVNTYQSPSYEGVDWNLQVCRIKHGNDLSPSYEGVDWNY